MSTENGVINIDDKRPMESGEEMCAPLIDINLGGKKLQLMIDFNALVLIEDRTGKAVMSMNKWSDMRIKDIRAMVWAALLHQDSKITELQVGKWLNMRNLPYAMGKISEAMALSTSGPKAETPEQSPLVENEPELPTVN